MDNNETRTGFFMKFEWYGALKKLSTKEQSTVLMNIYKYELSEELEKMSPRVEMFFETGIIPCIKHNRVLYEKRVEKNRKNGKKGGRPKKTITTENNPNNPVGFSENPNNPKDRNKDLGKVTGRVRDSDSHIDLSSTRLNSEFEECDNKIEYYKSLFFNVVSSSKNLIENMNSDQKRFKEYCCELCDKINYDSFMNLMFGDFDPNSTDLFQNQNQIDYIKKHYQQFLDEIVIPTEKQ